VIQISHQRRFIMKRKLAILAVSLLSLTCFALHSMAASDIPQSIPIGVLVSLSGFDSNFGAQAKVGYEFAAEDINKAGGIFVKEFGKKLPVELIIQDMESSPTKAASRMEWLYTSKKVVAYVGTTMITTGGTGVTEKNKVPTMAIASPRIVHHERGLKYLFSPVGKTPHMGKAILDLIDTIPVEKRPKSAAIFEEQADMGIETVSYLRKEAVQRNYKIVSDQKYSQMSKDFSPLLIAAKNAGAEMLLSSPVTPDGMIIMRQMKELDYNPKLIVLIRAADDLSWGKAMGAVGDSVIGMSFWHHAVKFPGVSELNSAHQAKLGRPADIHTGPAYASLQVIASAIEKAGTLDTTKIRDAVAATDMMTVTGRIRFDPNGVLIDPCPGIIQWQSGTQKLVWPKDFAEAPIAYPLPPWSAR
jgi:branched-chain amino acid transport system substrate-binding protein